MGFIKHFVDSREGEKWPLEHLLREEKIKKAIEQRDKFLEKHPHMKEYQQEIENVLNKCNSKDKIEVLSIMLGSKLNEFAEQLYKIQNINERFTKGSEYGIL